jgi:hypothetical protein
MGIGFVNGSGTNLRPLISFPDGEGGLIVKTWTVWQFYAFDAREIISVDFHFTPNEGEPFTATSRTVRRSGNDVTVVLDACIIYEYHLPDTTGGQVSATVHTETGDYSVQQAGWMWRRRP